MERKTAQSKPNNLVQTIERVSLILEMVGQNSQGMSIRDLSASLNLPKGTIHRILSSLSYFGYIRQDPETKIYFLGLKLMDLNAQLSNQLDFRKVAEPVLRDLAEKTKQTAHLVIYDRNEVVYVEKIETQQPAGGLKMASRVGSRNPAHSSAVGKVLLSCFSEEALEDFLQKKGLPRRTANTIIDPDAFREHLKIVRRQGYAMDDEENEQGIRCVGAPIFDGKGRPVAAISVSGSVFQVTKKVVHDVMKGAVMAAAAEISRRLGFQNGESGLKRGR
jgi:IclR family KDG regulon transcriptional repressor